MTARAASTAASNQECRAPSYYSPPSKRKLPAPTVVAGRAAGVKGEQPRHGPRRHMKPAQLAMVGGGCGRCTTGRPRSGRGPRRRGNAAAWSKISSGKFARTELRPGKSRDKVAEVVGVSGKSIDAGTKVLNNAIPEVIAAVDEGRMAVRRERCPASPGRSTRHFFSGGSDVTSSSSFPVACVVAGAQAEVHPQLERPYTGCGTFRFRIVSTIHLSFDLCQAEGRASICTGQLLSQVRQSLFLIIPNMFRSLILTAFPSASVMSGGFFWKYSSL